MATKQVDHITFSRLSNAYHVAFFSNVKAGIEKYDAEGLGLDADVYEGFTMNLDAEQDIVQKARSSAYTRELQEYDRIRDAYFRKIYYVLKNVENDIANPLVTKELVDKIAVHFLSQYGLGICQEANQKETAKLRGFIKDLREYLVDNLESLGIETDITNLETANNNYEKAYMARIAQYSVMPASTDLREKTENSYLHLCFLLAANANSISTEPAAKLHAKLCGRLIDEMNILIKDFKSKAYSGSVNNAEDEEPVIKEDTPVEETAENVDSENNQL